MLGSVSDMIVLQSSGCEINNVSRKNGFRKITLGMRLSAKAEAGETIACTFGSCVLYSTIYYLRYIYIYISN